MLQPTASCATPTSTTPVRNSPQYGEGVYVGSAGSNWSTYECTDQRERARPRGDNTERVLIEDNLFEDVTAEGADLKEGTDSGTLRRNTFRRTGTSGMNSADSAVDAKGNGWLIEGNTVRGCSGACLDAFQTHSVYSGYGTGEHVPRQRRRRPTSRLRVRAVPRRGQHRDV